MQEEIAGPSAEVNNRWVGCKSTRNPHHNVISGVFLRGLLVGLQTHTRSS